MFNRLFARVQDLFEGVPSFGERRVLLRLPQKLPVEYARGGGTVKAVVADIGMGGMLMAIPEVLSAGTTLEVRCPRHADLQPVRCCVRWTRPQRTGCQWVGVKFLDGPEKLMASWVKTVLTDSGQTPTSLRQRRKTFRVVTSLPVEVKSRKGEVLAKGTVVDLGTGGATFGSTVRVPVGATVFMFVAPGPLEGLPPLAVKGSVLAVKADPRLRNETHHHVAFADLGAGEGRLIRRYMREILRTTKRSMRR